MTTVESNHLILFNTFYLQLILLILQNKLHYMSGAAQKHVFGIMEEMLTEGRTAYLSKGI